MECEDESNKELEKQSASLLLFVFIVGGLQGYAEKKKSFCNIEPSLYIAATLSMNLEAL